MNYRQLGPSSLQVSTIGFGCMSLKNDGATNIRILQTAAGRGINYFDTADLYNHGANEETVGKAFKEIRKDVIIATKVGNQWRPDGTGWDWNPTKEYIMKAVEESLKRLGTDYIDLYQLHGGTLDDPIDETIGTFEQLLQQGKIRYYGISSIRPNVIREWVKRSHMVSVMLQYSLLDRRPEEEILPLLQQKNIGVVIRGSVAQGLLVDKEAKPYPGHTADSVLKAKEKVLSLSKNRTPAQTASRFVLHHPAVSSVVVGIRTQKQLEEAARIPATPELTAEEYNELKQTIPALKYEEHRNSCEL